MVYTLVLGTSAVTGVGVRLLSAAHHWYIMGISMMCPVINSRTYGESPHIESSRDTRHYT